MTTVTERTTPVPEPNTDLPTQFTISEHHTSTPPVTAMPERTTPVPQPNIEPTTSLTVPVETLSDPDVAPLDPVNQAENAGPSKDTDRRNQTSIDDFSTTSTTSSNGLIVHGTTETIQLNRTFECLE